MSNVCRQLSKSGPGPSRFFHRCCSCSFHSSLHSEVAKLVHVYPSIRARRPFAFGSDPAASADPPGNLRSCAARCGERSALEEAPKKKKSVRARSLSRPRRTRGRYLARVGGGGGPREPLPVSRSLRSALQSRSSWRRANSSGASRRRPQLQNAVRAAACCVLRCALWGPGRPGRGRRASPWRLPVPRPAATPESNAERR